MHRCRFKGPGFGELSDPLADVEVMFVDDVCDVFARGSPV